MSNDIQTILPNRASDFQLIFSRIGTRVRILHLFRSHRLELTWFCDIMVDVEPFRDRAGGE